jgi:hypothetical protein
MFKSSPNHLTLNHAFNRTRPVRAFYSAIVGGGAWVDLVLLGG